MKKVGLALGGGVVRGIAHIGVLAVLERAGIPVDCVSGTSVGALIGVFCAAGWDAEGLRGLAQGLGWRHLARPAWPGRGGLVSFYQLECLIAGKLGNATFADLPRPFAVVTTDAATGDPFMITQGLVAPAVRASASVPGLVVPAVIDGRTLADAGVSDNLPVGAARALGAEYVIGVNIFGGRWRQSRSPWDAGSPGWKMLSAGPVAACAWPIV